MAHTLAAGLGVVIAGSRLRRALAFRPSRVVNRVHGATARGLPMAPAWAAMLLALALPWTTRWSLSVFTQLPEDAGADTPEAVLRLGALVVLALLCARLGDVPLGAFTALVAVSALRNRGDYALDLAMGIGAGIGLLLVTRQLPAAGHRYAVVAFLLTGIAQACLALQQALGFDMISCGLDPCFSRDVVNHTGAWVQHPPVVGGMFGNPAFLAIYLALLASLSPHWIITAVLVGGVALTQSFTGLAAAGVGLAVQYRAQWRISGAFAVGLLLGALAMRPQFLSWSGRWTVHWAAVRDWWAHAPSLGYGPDGWWLRVPKLQQALGMKTDLYVQPHNEYVGLAFAFGVLGLTTLALWLIQHHGMFRGPYAGTIAALAVALVSMPVVHQATLIVPAIVLLGLATGRA